MRNDSSWANRFEHFLFPHVENKNLYVKPKHEGGYKFRRISVYWIRKRKTQYIDLDRFDVPQLEHMIVCIFLSGKFAKRKYIEWYHSKRRSIKSNQTYESNENVSNGLDFSVCSSSLFLNENYQQPEQQYNDRCHTQPYTYIIWAEKKQNTKNNQNKTK